MRRSVVLSLPLQGGFLAFTHWSITCSLFYGSASVDQKTIWPTYNRPRDMWLIDIWPTDIWPTDICPSDIWPTDIWPTDIWSVDIWPTDIWPADIWPTDIWPTGIWPTDIWRLANTHLAEKHFADRHLADTMSGRHLCLSLIWLTDNSSTSHFVWVDETTVGQIVFDQNT